MSILTRWDPFSEIARLHGDLSRNWGTSQPAFQPAVDIYEEEDAIVLKAEVPGMTSDEIEVNVEKNVLSLSGERRLENEEKREGYHRVERSYGAFTRSFVLPENVDGENIDANLEGGVLTLRLPKKPQAERKRIEVRSKNGNGN